MYAAQYCRTFSTGNEIKGTVCFASQTHLFLFEPNSGTFVAWPIWNLGVVPEFQDTAIIEVTETAPKAARFMGWDEISFTILFNGLNLWHIVVAMYAS